MQFPDPRQPQAMLALTLTVGASSLALPDGAFRVVPGLLLVFALPGLALMHLTDPDGIAEPRAIAMIPGLSMVVTILAGLVVALAGLFKPTPVALALTLCTAALFRLADVRNRAHGDGSGSLLTPPVSYSAVMTSAAGRLAISVPLCALVVAISAYLAVSHREFSVTEFWLLPKAASTSIHTVGIRNLETAARTYAVDVYANGALAAHIGGIELAPDATWTHDIAVPAIAAGPGDARAELYLIDAAHAAHSRLYRTVWSTRKRPTISDSH